MKRGMEFIRLLTEFFDSYLPDTKGVSENTIRSYKAALRIFFIFLEEEKGIPAGKVTFSVLDSSIVDEFLSWIETTRGCSKQTRNQRLAALSSFAKFALRRDVVSAGAFSSCVLGTERKRASKRSGDDVVFFLPEEMQILLSLPNRQTICGRRDVVLMSFLYASGARAQELCDLTANDVTFGVETRVRLVGKGSKARRIVIPNECADLLRVHFKQAGLFYGDKNRHVFSSQRNEPYDDFVCRGSCFQVCEYG